MFYFMLRISIVSLLIAGAAGCVTATPVTPAPMTAAEYAELKNILPGKWLWMASSKTANGDKDGVGGLYEAIRTYTFNTDGTSRLGRTQANWSLDGANIIGSVLGDARVDEFSPNELKLFIYANSTWMYFKRK